MGYTEAADGSLTITDDTSNPVDDLQKISDLAVKRGGMVRVTSSQRTQLTASQTQVGWLIVETDTGRIFYRSATEPQGELMHVPVIRRRNATPGVGASLDPTNPLQYFSDGMRADLSGAVVLSSGVWQVGYGVCEALPETIRPFQSRFLRYISGGAQGWIRVEPDGTAKLYDMQGTPAAWIIVVGNPWPVI